MKKINYIILPLVILCSAYFANAAQTVNPAGTNDTLSAFRKYMLPNVNIDVPTVVEVPIDMENLERPEIVVFNQSDNMFVPIYFRRDTFSNLIPISVSSDVNPSTASKMIDENIYTYADFPLTAETAKVSILVTAQSPIVSSSLTYLLDEYVAWPAFVEIRAKGADGIERVVVARRSIFSQTVNFPRTTSDNWTIIFTYTQPLRISEFKLRQDNAVKTSLGAVRFLAQRLKNYFIYFDADRPVSVSTGEAGNLADNTDVLVLPMVQISRNMSYRIADVDNDRIPDKNDNCANISNPDQADINKNGIGDACDDYDKDGLINTKDNCPNDPNRDQRDIDGDKMGDACDKVESRITEAYPWLPWVGIGFAALVVIGLFALTARSKPPTPGQV